MIFPPFSMFADYANLFGLRLSVVAHQSFVVVQPTTERLHYTDVVEHPKYQWHAPVKYFSIEFHDLSFL